MSGEKIMVSKDMEKDIDRVLISEKELSETVKRLGAQISEDYKDKDVIVYCRSGHRSITACNLLSMEGFNKLYNLERGIIEY
jgi:rhodanese-related sulfurtransferase